MSRSRNSRRGSKPWKRYGPRHCMCWICTGSAQKRATLRARDLSKQDGVLMRACTMRLKCKEW